MNKTSRGIRNVRNKKDSVGAQLAISLDQVSKRYKHFELNNVSMKIPQGTVAGLIGPNGAGRNRKGGCERLAVVHSLDLPGRVGNRRSIHRILFGIANPQARFGVSCYVAR